MIIRSAGIRSKYKSKKPAYLSKNASLKYKLFKLLNPLNNQIYRDCNLQWPDESQPRYSLKMDHIVQ